MDVVYRAMEMNKEHEARPWFEELQALDGGTHRFSFLTNELSDLTADQ
jgi:hypothetical protein